MICYEHSTSLGNIKKKICIDMYTLLDWVTLKKYMI